MDLVIIEAISDLKKMFLRDVSASFIEELRTTCVTETNELEKIGCCAYSGRPKDKLVSGC